RATPRWSRRQRRSSRSSATISPRRPRRARCWERADRKKPTDCSCRYGRRALFPAVSCVALPRVDTVPGALDDCAVAPPTDAMTHVLPATNAAPRTMRIGLDHVVMAGAVVCLVVLVVLPVGALMGGSLVADGGISLDNFREAVTGRLYVQALMNSLILGGL